MNTEFMSYCTFSFQCAAFAGSCSAFNAWFTRSPKAKTAILYSCSTSILSNLAGYWLPHLTHADNVIHTLALYILAYGAAMVISSNVANALGHRISVPEIFKLEALKALQAIIFLIGQNVYEQRQYA